MRESRVHKQVKSRAVAIALAGARAASVAQTLLSCVWTFCSNLIEVIRTVCRPSLVLWPWVIGVLAFDTLLSSPQGASVARDTRYVGWEGVGVFALATGIGVLVAIGCLLALVAWNACLERSEQGVRHSPLVPIAGIWILLLSASYGMQLALATSSATLWTATSVVLLLVGTATWMVWRAVGRANSQATKALHFATRHRWWLAALTVVVALVPLLIGGYVVRAQPMALATLGPLAVGLIGFGALATLFAAILITLPLCFNAKWVGALFMVGMFAWSASGPASVDGENPLLHEEREQAYDSQSERTKACRSQPSLLTSALNAKVPPRPKKGEPDPEPRTMYLVSAEGGGIRAAYWAAVVLGTIDIETNDKVLEDVATVSGVSGGSLGIATWLAARERSDLKSEERLEVAKDFLRSDFLSPLLGGLLFLDVPRAVLGPAWFEARRDHVFEKALANRWTQVGKTNFFARPWRYICVSGFVQPPAIFFNATEASSGSFVPMSPTRINRGSTARNGLRVALATTTLRWATVAQVVHISARFPYLSPAAEVGVDAADVARNLLDVERSRHASPISDSAVGEESSEDRDALEVERLRREGLFARVGVLVDGGYFDNTALTPSRAAMEIVKDGRAAEAKRAPSVFKPFTSTTVRLIHLSNDPGTSCERLTGDWMANLTERARRYLQVTKTSLKCVHQLEELEKSLLPSPMQWLFAPLETIISARSAHSKGQLASAVSEVYALTGRYDSAVNNLSVEQELKDVHGELDEVLQVRPRPEMTAQTVAQLKSMAASAQEANLASNEELQRFSKAIAAFERLSAARERKLSCTQGSTKSSPPLGWMLNRDSRETLDCLAIRATFRGGFGALSIPNLQVVEPKDNPYISR